MEWKFHVEILECDEGFLVWESDWSRTPSTGGIPSAHRRWTAPDPDALGKLLARLTTEHKFLRNKERAIEMSKKSDSMTESQK